MVKVRYINGLILVFLFLLISFFSIRSALADDSSPKSAGDTSLYTLRYHSSGSILRTTLALYTKSSKKPTTPQQFTISRSGGVYGCKPSNRSGDANATVTINLKGVVDENVYSGKLNSGNCKNDDNSTPDSGVFRNYTIATDRWDWDNSTKKYYVNLTIELSNPSGKTSDYDDYDSRAWFQFRAIAQGNSILMANRANDRFSGSKTNYGVTNTGEYILEFAQPCDAGDESKVAGMWDPDKFNPNKMKIQQSPRDGNNWINTPISATAGIIDDDDDDDVPAPDGDGWFYIVDGNAAEARLQFTMNATQKYRIRYDTDPTNVVSLFWPYGTINSEITCKEYELTPHINDVASAVDPGGSLSVTGDVTHQGWANSNPTDYRITRIVYPSNANFNDIDNKNLPGGATEPCAAMRSIRNSADCTAVDQQPNRVFARDTTTAVSFTDTMSMAVGSRVCFAISVNSSTHIAGSGWAHSTMQCSIVAKRPKVQFLGSDVRVQGRISASLSEDIGGKTYGSWMEYGAFAGKGQANSIASSGAGLRDGNPNKLNNKKQWSGLTFANTNDPYGNYGDITKVNNGAYFKNIGPSKLWSDWDGDATESGIYDAGSASITINANLSGKSKSIIIRTLGTVTINGDLTMADESYANAKEISQVVIVAKDINVQSNVKRIDAWLIADAINTCSNRPTYLTSGAPCNEQLAVNGPVDTGTLYLNRTYGANAGDPQVAAEVFNLRPSAYMWAYNYINQQDRARTTYVTELAPRL